MWLSQLRPQYAELRNRQSAFVVVGPSAPANSDRVFRHYLGETPPELHYLCDPTWAVHSMYGLQPVRLRERAALYSASTAALFASRSSVQADPLEASRMIVKTLQQGLFGIDEAGVVRYAHVSSPSTRLPPFEDVLAPLDVAKEAHP